MYRSSIRRAKFQRYLPVAVVAIVFGAIGTYLIVQSNAATPTASVQTENGTVASPATKIADSTASGGSAIKFGYAATTTGSTALLLSDFENTTVADPISLADFRVTMNDTDVNAGLTETAVKSETGHGKFMRQKLLPNALSDAGGIVAFPDLTQTVDEASMQYDVRFVGAFDWNGGGKLPGLAGVTPGKGLSDGVASGCNVGSAYAWSGRGMWHGPKVFNLNDAANEWVGYMYNLYKTADCGNDIRTGKAFVANQWHTIKQYYKMNTPGVADGVHKMWFDGQLVVNNNAYKYRSNNEVHINMIYWSVFRGGSDPFTWASTQTSYIDFDNIRVSTPGL